MPARNTASRFRPISGLRAWLWALAVATLPARWGLAQPDVGRGLEAFVPRPETRSWAPVQRLAGAEPGRDRFAWTLKLPSPPVRLYLHFPLLWGQAVLHLNGAVLAVRTATTGAWQVEVDPAWLLPGTHVLEMNLLPAPFAHPLAPDRLTPWLPEAWVLTRDTLWLNRLAQADTLDNTPADSLRRQWRDSLWKKCLTGTPVGPVLAPADSTLMLWPVGPDGLTPVPDSILLANLSHAASLGVRAVWAPGGLPPAVAQALPGLGLRLAPQPGRWVAALQAYPWLNPKEHAVWLEADGFAASSMGQWRPAQPARQLLPPRWLLVGVLALALVLLALWRLAEPRKFARTWQGPLLGGELAFLVREDRLFTPSLLGLAVLVKLLVQATAIALVLGVLHANPFDWSASSFGGQILDRIQLMAGRVQHMPSLLWLWVLAALAAWQAAQQLLLGLLQRALGLRSLASPVLQAQAVAAWPAWPLALLVLLAAALQQPLQPPLAQAGVWTLGLAWLLLQAGTLRVLLPIRPIGPVVLFSYFYLLEWLPILLLLF